MNDRELLQPVVPRHRFSMVIVHADDGYEDLRIDLDDRAELKYGVNKAAVIGDDHNMRGFVRLVSELEEGETKTFAWVTAHGIKEWTLSRGPSALSVNVPEFGEWFSIPYEPFRDECRAAYERYYGWGYEAENIRLSQLKDTWEECGFRYNVSMDPDDWHDAVYRRYGDLPDGRHFGVYLWPKSEAWPPESAMMIVSKTGEMQVNTIIDDRWDVRAADRWPLAAVASPSGKSIVWLKDGRIWVWREDWHRDKQDIRFQPDDGEELTDRIEGTPVYDAL
ncbi:MAG: hypothetical protein J6Y95_03015, partial [Lachnospiraceae bacterium]|nr:hypothetical protein [Lachnospiraceae bacterium]